MISIALPNGINGGSTPVIEPILVNVLSAVNDTVNITDNLTGETSQCVTDINGTGTALLMPDKEYTFTSSIAKAIDGSSDYYSRSVTVVKDVSVRVFPLEPNENYLAKEYVPWYGNYDGWLGEAVPQADKGETVTINGLQFMSVNGVDRFVYMGTLGTAQWQTAINNAQSTSSTPYAKLAEKYNVTNPSLLSKNEVDSMGTETCKKIYTAVGSNIWSATQANVSEGYAFGSSGSVFNVTKSVNYNCVPAYTISGNIYRP